MYLYVLSSPAGVVRRTPLVTLGLTIWVQPDKLASSIKILYKQKRKKLCSSCISVIVVHAMVIILFSLSKLVMLTKKECCHKPSSIPLKSLKKSEVLKRNQN